MDESTASGGRLMIVNDFCARKARGFLPPPFCLFNELLTPTFLRSKNPHYTFFFLTIILVWSDHLHAMKTIPSPTPSALIPPFCSRSSVIPVTFRNARSYADGVVGRMILEGKGGAALLSDDAFAKLVLQRCWGV